MAIEDRTGKLTNHLKNNSDCQSSREETIRILPEMSNLIGHPLVKKRKLFYDIPPSGEKSHSEMNSGTNENSMKDINKLFKQLKEHLEADKKSARFIQDVFHVIEIIQSDDSGFGEPYQYLNGYGIVNDFVTPIGINELGLTARIGSKFKHYISEADRKFAVENGIVLVHGLDPEEFADALEEELEFLNYVCLELEQPSKINYHRICQSCVNALQREFEKFEILNKPVIGALRQMASELHENKQSVGIAKITGGAAGVAGGAMMIVGMILEPLTFGAATSLIIAGTVIAGVGGAVNVGAGVTDMVKRHAIGKINPQGEEQMLMKTLDNLMDLVKLSYRNMETAAIPNAVDRGMKGLGVGGKVVHAIRAIGGTGAAVLRGLKASGDISLGILEDTIKFSAAGVGVAFDLLSIVDSGITLAKGGKSELGYKLALDAEELETALDKQRMWIRELRQSLELNKD